ncbi:MAG TPA: DUF1003 domain-containing protein [Chitinophagaceae bacterium]|nr:DUF1003 domain-containing protein [Chitinophagaceae bacterium]
MKAPVIDSFHDYIRQQVPGYEESADLPDHQLNDLRKNYIEQLLREELGELTEVEKTVARSIGRKKILSDIIRPGKIKEYTPGEKLADKVASFGGSWKFIIIFFSFLTGWILLNIWWWHNKGFDPYPFILLNLLLSCIAAIQAPIIMMSQNRQEAKDRIRAEHDYKVNLKAEMEIRMLHEKIDHMLLHQNKRLLEIQKVQIELLESISKVIREKG